MEFLRFRILNDIMNDDECERTSRQLSFKLNFRSNVVYFVERTIQMTFSTSA